MTTSAHSRRVIAAGCCFLAGGLLLARAAMPHRLTEPRTAELAAARLPRRTQRPPAGGGDHAPASPSPPLGRLDADASRDDACTPCCADPAGYSCVLCARAVYPHVLLRPLGAGTSSDSAHPDFGVLNASVARFGPDEWFGRLVGATVLPLHQVFDAADGAYRLYWDVSAVRATTCNSMDVEATTPRRDASVVAAAAAAAAARAVCASGPSASAAGGAGVSATPVYALQLLRMRSAWCAFTPESGACVAPTAVCPAGPRVGSAPWARADELFVLAGPRPLPADSPLRASLTAAAGAPPAVGGGHYELPAAQGDADGLPAAPLGAPPASVSRYRLPWPVSFQAALRWVSDDGSGGGGGTSAADRARAAAARLPHTARLLFSGDSQVRTLFNGVMRVVAGVDGAAGKNATLPSATFSVCHVLAARGGGGAVAGGAAACYRGKLFGGWTAEDVAGYDAVVLNVGNWPFSKGWALPRYAALVDDAVAFVRAATAAPGGPAFVWFGTPAYAAPAASDGRCNPKIAAGNAYAAAAFGALAATTTRARVVDGFAATFPITDASPDGSHYAVATVDAAHAEAVTAAVAAALGA